MPAGRDCVRCGQVLGSDVRWCLACYEPVREFTPRPEGVLGGFVGDPVPDRSTSRWAASPTTFGPAGRLAVTAVVLAVGAAELLVLGTTPFGLWFLLGFAIIAAFVLRSTWRPVPVQTPDPGRVGALARRMPRLAVPVPRWGWLVLAVVALIGAAFAWWTLGDVDRFFVAAGAIAFAVGCLLARANEL